MYYQVFEILYTQCHFSLLQETATVAERGSINNALHSEKEQGRGLQRIPGKFCQEDRA